MPTSKKTSSQARSSVLRSFSSRHIGLRDNERDEILNDLGYSTFEAFIKDLSGLRTGRANVNMLDIINMTAQNLQMCTRRNHSVSEKISLSTTF